MGELLEEASNHYGCKNNYKGNGTSTEVNLVMRELHPQAEHKMVLNCLKSER